MSSKTWRLFLNYGVLSAFLFLLILQPLIHINNSQTFSQLSTEKSPSQIGSSVPQDQSSTDYTELPFFQNSTPLISWFEASLQDNTTLPEKPVDPSYPFYFASTDRSGTSVLDNNHYLEDFAVYLKGCTDLLGLTNSQKLAYLYRLLDLGFKNSTEKGYYSSVNGDWSQNSTVKEVTSNAQLILSLIDLISDPQVGSQVQNLMPDLWLAISSNFNHKENLIEYGFNHSTSDSEKYMEDQFIAAISGFLIHRANLASVKAAALLLASDTMKKMVDGSILIYRYDSFDFKRGLTLTEDLAADHNRDLSTNAWGIWALLEWFIEDGMPTSDATYKRVEKAERVFRTLNRTLWNSSSSLFMTKTNQDGSTILDSQMLLKDNAVMLMATKRLFEVTGNFTYYKTCMQLYSGIERNFRDTLYGNYYFGVNGTSGEIDTQKNFKAHAYLIQSYSMMESLAKKSAVSLTFNSTNIILGQANFLNISARFTVSYQITLPSPSSPKSMSAQIQGADFNYVIRDPEGEVIKIQDMVGGTSGNANYYYPIPSIFALGSYSVALRVNFTGLETKYAQKSFSLSSGVSIKSYQLITSPIYPSSDLSFNITVNNTRIANLNATVNVTGLDIVNATATFTNQSFTFSNLTTRTYTVQLNSSAIFGSRSIVVDIIKDNLIYATSIVPITIASSLKIENIQYDQTTFRNTTFEIKLNTRNLISESQSLWFKVTGDYVNGSNSLFNVSAFSTLQVAIPLLVSSNALYGKTSILVNISRAIDGTVVETKSLELIIKPLVEFVSIVVPNQLDQGKQNYVTCSLINNRNDIRYVQVSMVPVNTFVPELKFPLQPGLNEISIPIGSKFYGPYAFGVKSFNLTIYDTTDTTKSIIYEELIVLNLKSTIGTILLGYVLPVIIPCVGVVIMKHLSTENKKRLGV